MNLSLWRRYGKYLLSSRCARINVARLLDFYCYSGARRNLHVRRLEFAQLTKEDVDHFATFLRPHEMVSDENDLVPYNRDWLGRYVGKSKLVLKPRSTEQVAHILKYCSEKSLAVCPQGGNTGLVGGSVPVFDEIIVSTANLNKIIKFDDLSGILICEAGCILENLQEFVSDQSYTVPLDLGSKGSCHIGGNLATNAGGLRLVRYGSLRGNVLGLEVVLPSGEILDCMSAMRKDNTGYDLKQLFVGSEGTLGIITKVSLLCSPKPNSVAVVFLGCSTFEDVLLTYRIARKQLGEIISSVEFMDHECILLTERNLKLKPPLSPHSFYVLIEVAGACAQHDREKLDSFLEDALKRGFIKDGILATDSRHIKNLWAVREKITESLKLDGFVYKYDVSLPLANFYELVTRTRAHLGNSVNLCCGFGHLGDGNLHLNIGATHFSENIERKIESFVFNEISEWGGSISAEHGVGFMKRHHLHYSKNQCVIRAMKELKTIYDAKCIMNPYKMLPLWECRERLAEAQKMDGYVYKYDVSISLENFNDFVTVLRNRVGDKCICCVAYGHLGDSNLHLNFTSAIHDEFIERTIEPFIFEVVQKLKGSVSAEHGIGQKHRVNIKYSKTERLLSQMEKIKGQYDPKRILNPYKILSF